MCIVQDDASDAWLGQMEVGSRHPLQHRYISHDSSPTLHQETDRPKHWSAVEEQHTATSRVRRRTSRQDGSDGLIQSWSNQLDIRGDSGQVVDRNWSGVEEVGGSDGARAFDAGFPSTERPIPTDVKAVVEERQLTSPQTVCHVRVTVRHRSPRRGGRDLVHADSRDAAPVPALRRSGSTATKRTPPTGRRVTFSGLPPDERRPMFAAPRRQQNAPAGVTQAPLDTLWHYHETYPSMDSSRHVGRPQGTFGVLAQPDDHVASPQTPRSGNENTKQTDDVITLHGGKITAPEKTGELANHDAPSSPHDDDADDGGGGGGQQQLHGSRLDEADEFDEVSLSLKQLVASFESMTSPFMRAPVIAGHPARVPTINN